MDLRCESCYSHLTHALAMHSTTEMSPSSRRHWHYCVFYSIYHYSMPIFSTNRWASFYHVAVQIYNRFKYNNLVVSSVFVWHILNRKWVKRFQIKQIMETRYAALYILLWMSKLFSIKVFARLSLLYRNTVCINLYAIS